jgi:hypothetical protein
LEYLKNLLDQPFIAAITALSTGKPSRCAFAITSKTLA